MLGLRRTCFAEVLKMSQMSSQVHIMTKKTPPMTA